jgi:hypothetical protein
MVSRASVASMAFVVIVRKAYGYPAKTDYPNLASKLTFPVCRRGSICSSPRERLKFPTVDLMLFHGL